MCRQLDLSPRIRSNAEEVWDGKHVFRVYSKSKFLDFVERGTFATSDFPGPFKHYQIQSLYPIIDVASCEGPEVTVALSRPSPTE